VSFLAEERDVESVLLWPREAAAHVVVRWADQICERCVRETGFRLRRARTDYAQAALGRACYGRAPDRGLADARVSVEQEDDVRALGRVEESPDGSELNSRPNSVPLTIPPSFEVSIVRRPPLDTLSAATRFGTSRAGFVSIYEDRAGEASGPDRST